MADNVVKATMILAMEAVLSDTDEYRLRQVCRWFSETYHTPLAVVETELPIEYVLQHYYETHYAELNHISRREVARKLIETDEERRARLEREEKDRRRGLSLGKELAEKGLDALFAKAKIAHLAPRPDVKAISDDQTKKILKDAPAKLQDFKPIQKEIKEADLPKASAKKDIEIEFGTLFDDDVDFFSKK